MDDYDKHIRYWALVILFPAQMAKTGYCEIFAKNPGQWQPLPLADNDLITVCIWIDS